MKNIKGIAIAVRAGIREAENELILDTIDHYFGHMGIETVSRISICQTESLDDLTNYLAVHENGPCWSREVYPLRSHAEEDVVSA